MKRWQYFIFTGLDTYAHDTLAGNSRWNPAPESSAGFQREFPARVATKFALCFQR